MSGIRARDYRVLPYFPVTKAETARLAELADTRTLPYLRSLYFAVLELANDHRTAAVPASRAELAARAGVSPATVKRLTPVLVSAGLVDVEESAGYASIWTVLGVADPGHSDPGVGSDRPGGSGQADPGVGSDSRGGSGLTDPGLKETGQKGRKQSPTEPVKEVWEGYLAARKRFRPRSNGCKLGDAERKIITEALKVRELDDVLAAVEGLFKSDWHTGGEYLGINYALRGGGKSPVPGATIDRMAALARGGANGNGRPHGLFADKTFGGRSWDELTRREQENVKESAMMGRESWDGGKDDPARPAPARSGNGHVPGWTAANFASED